jgi:hypothetical protein
MASKHMVNGRRALRNLEKHIKDCTPAPATPAPAEDLAGFTVPAEIQSIPLSDLGKEIGALRERWQHGNGNPRRVAAKHRADQRAGIERLRLLEKCFKIRLKTELED